MKSGVACALKIFYDIKEKVIIHSHNIVFVFYDGEEGPIPNGITRLLEANMLRNIDFAYVLEPTCLRYSVGCLGSLTATVKINGAAAHSANPKEGINAIYEAAKTVSKIKETDAKLSVLQEIDGLKFYETVNVTQLTTLNPPNVIPPHLYLTVNFRFSPKRSRKDAESFVRNLVGDAEICRIDYGSPCYVSGDNYPFLKNGAEKEIMQAWTDIAQLNDAGITAVAFGAGDIKYAHREDEFIDISQLLHFYELLKLHI
jgi:acetylornithine deacetylase/succinyl-diaminopimelate desuccinylase-like protein